MNATYGLEITAEGWEGIFLSEPEAAWAMAGHGMPERVLEHDSVSSDTRLRAARSAEERAEILGSGGGRILLKLWSYKPDEGWIPEYSVQLTIERTDIRHEGDITRNFRIAIGGRAYDPNEAELIDQMLVIALRLIKAAQAIIAQDKLIKTVTEEEQ